MKTITDVNGTSYTLLSGLGKGGQGKVWKVMSGSDGKYYAFKAYKHNTNNIRHNIENLVEISKKGGFHDRDGHPMTSIIPPLAMINLEGDSFGYIMDMVDLDSYITLLDACSDGKYPSCEAICHIIQNFASVFETLHLTYGMCYKDVNEGNIYFNPVTGDLKIIDNDNVGYRDNYTVKGTSGYMSPEVVLGSKPNHNSDRFSFAVFAYRLLVGGWPFAGPYTRQYCEDNDILPDDAAEVIFGSDPVFVWNPNDTRNSITNETNPKTVRQAAAWNRLPQSVKDLFIDVFVTNLPAERCAHRATSDNWKNIFRTLGENLKPCSSCGRMTFSDAERCFECFAPLRQRHEAVIQIMSLGEPKRTITVHPGDEFFGRSISKHLSSGKLFRVLYNKQSNDVGIQNISGDSWHLVHADGTKEDFLHGQIKAVSSGMSVRIIYKKAQLNIIGVS